MKELVEQLIKEIKDQYLKYDHKEFEAASYKEKIHNQEILVILNSVSNRLHYLAYQAEECDNYIKQLESQISRDRESLVNHNKYQVFAALVDKAKRDNQRG